MTSLTTQGDSAGKQNGDLEIPWHLVAVFIGMILAAIVVAIIWMILKRRLMNIRRRQAALRIMNSTRSEAAFASLSHARHQYIQPRYDLNQPRPDYTIPRFELPPRRDEWETDPQPVKPRPSLPEPKVEPVEIKPSEGAGTTVYSLVAKDDDSSTYMPPSKLVYADFKWSEENKEEPEPKESNNGYEIDK